MASTASSSTFDTSSLLPSESTLDSPLSTSLWDNIYEEEYGEDNADDGFSGSNRDCVVFLIDAQPAMFEKNDSGEVPFVNAVKAAIAVCTDKIISSDKDIIGVCLYGTKEKKNLNDFENIYVLQDLDEPDAHRILELENLIQTEEMPYGSSSKEFPLCDALWTCSTMFSTNTAKVGMKRIFLFTNEDNPNADDGSVVDQSKQRAKDLAELGIDIELFPFKKAGQDAFDPTLFYQYIISIGEDDDTGGQFLVRASERFQELQQQVRKKEYSKRSLGKLPLIIRPGVEIAVNLFNVIQECKKGSFVWLDPRNHQRVKTVTKWICDDTGSLLLNTQIKKYYMYGGEKIEFEDDELKAIKVIDTPGIRLMGFKPRKALKDYHNVRNCSFIYPNDKIIKGSVVAFAALLERMLALDKIAICRFTPRKNASAKFVALLPQKEEFDEDGAQMTPPGMHVIYLPFADDIRNLPYGDQRRAEEAQVDLAKTVVKKLRIPFDSRSFENPSLQKHYASLQALALEREEVEDVPDYVVPDEEGMEKYASDDIKAFRAAVYGDEDDSSRSVGKKRSRADSGDQPAKRTRNVEIDDYSDEAKVKKLTIPLLKEYLSANRVSFSSGDRKAALVEKVVTHASK